LPKQSLPESLKPASQRQTIACVSTCLALVRPVGMSDEMASEWLHIASDDLAIFPVDILMAGCKHARRTCDHYSKIVPAVFAYCEEAMAMRRLALRPRAAVALPAPKVPNRQPMTADELTWLNGPGELRATLRRLGLSAGALAENEDGTVSETGDDFDLPEWAQDEGE